MSIISEKSNNITLFFHKQTNYASILNSMNRVIAKKKHSKIGNISKNDYFCNKTVTPF